MFQIGDRRTVIADFRGLWSVTITAHIFLEEPPLMPEAEIKNLEIVPKPKCLRCGAQHTVSDLGHWMPGWWTCQVCNIRWEEDEFD